MDVFSADKRSQVMRAVKSQDTGVEMVVRRLLHKAGFRYRLHRKDLPGKPDITFPGRRKIIVNACFWHQHQGCHYADQPSSRTEYWQIKIDKNAERDSRNMAALQEQGWDVLVVWECQARDQSELAQELFDFLKV